jgi:hypothetical protein
MKLKVWIGITFASLMIVATAAQTLPHAGIAGAGNAAKPEVLHLAAVDTIPPMVVAAVDPIDPWMPRNDG